MRNFRVDPTKTRHAVVPGGDSQRYKHLVDRLQVVTWEADPTTFDFVYVSEHAATLLGYPVSDWLQPGFWAAHLHPEDRDWAASFCLEAVRSLQDHRFEYRMIHADGRVIWVEDVVTVVVEDNRPTGLYGAILEITSRKEADQALREGRLQLSSMTSAAHLIHQHVTDCICTLSVDADDELRIVSINPAFTSLTGVKPADVIGKALSAVVPGTSYSKVVEQYRRAVDERRSIRWEQSIRLHTGIKFGEFCLTPVFDGDSQCIRLIATIHDVTDRKLAEQKLKDAEASLRAGEARYRTFVDHAIDAFFLLNVPDGEILDVNDEACRSLGYDRDELVGATPALFDTRGGRDQLAKIFAWLDDEDTMAFDSVHRRKDGGRFPVEVRIRTYRVDGRRFALASARDITDRVESEAALRESEERFRQLAESAFEGLMIHEGGIIRDANQAFASLFGFESTKPLIGRACLDVMRLTAESQEIVLAQWRTPRSDEFEVDAEYPDGVRRTFVTRGRETVYQGRPARVAALRDVTNRKRVEKALRESEQQFRNAFDFASIGMALVGLDGRWLKVNRALCDIVGYTSEELTATDFQSITHPDDRADDREAVRRLIAGEIPFYQREKRYHHKDGRIVRIFLSASLIRDETGTPLHFVSQIQDVTEQRRMEEQLRHSQKMEAIGRLARGIAHDFNNLLTIINGHSRLMLGNLPPNDRRRDGLAAIEDAGLRAAALVRQLLAFSRGQALQPVLLDLNEVILGLEPLFVRLLGPHVELRLHCASVLDAIRADRSQMEQVLMNLVVNARDAMPDGGTLTIQTEAVETSSVVVATTGPLEPGRYIRLAVTDTGEGMTADSIAKIFEPFYTTKEVGKGTGLGLSVVHGIVNQNGGQINVTGRPGAGATFTVYIPFAKRRPFYAPLSD